MQSDIVSYYELYSFTKMRVSAARSSARAGRKDEAREFLRYVRGARIIEILKPIDFSSIGLPSVDVSHLQWQLLRRENGEATGRYHYHALIAGLPAHVITKPTCFATMKLWERVGGGMARVTQYDPSLDGVDYILKNGEQAISSLASRKAGDYYELTKFGGTCDLMLSESLCDHLYQRTLVVCGYFSCNFIAAKITRQRLGEIWFAEMRRVVAAAETPELFKSEEGKL